MIVCHCAVVSCRDVAAAVRAGARSVGEACRRTGAAQQCGTCVFSVRQVFCQHQADVDADRQEPIRAAS